MWSLSLLGLDLSLPTTSARARAFAALAQQQLEHHELPVEQLAQTERRRRRGSRLPQGALQILRAGGTPPADSLDELIKGLTRIKLSDGHRIVDRLQRLHPRPAQLAAAAINQRYYEVVPQLLARGTPSELSKALRLVERAERWDVALQLAERLPADRPSAIASRMRSYVELGEPSKAIHEFSRHESMLSSHRMTLITLMEAHLRMRNIDRAERVRLKLIELGHGADIRLQSAIGRAIKAMGLVPELEQLLLRDFRTSPLSLSVLNPMLRMRSYEASHQQLANIMSCYRFDTPELPANGKDDSRPIADIHTYTILVSLCGRCRNLAGVRQVWAGLLATGIIRDVQAWTIAALVRALINAGNLEGARKLLENVVARKRDPWGIPPHVQLDEEPFVPLLRAAAGRLDTGEIKRWLRLEREARVRPGVATVDAIVRGLQGIAGSPRYLGTLRSELFALVDQDPATGSARPARPRPPSPVLTLNSHLSPRRLFRQLHDANIPLDHDRLLDIVRKYHWHNLSDYAADAVVEARALGLAPTLDIWQSLLGHLLARDGHTRSAARTIDRLRRLGIPMPSQQVHTDIGSGLLARKQFRLADEYMSLALALTPHPDSILITVAFQAKLRNKRPDEAAHLLRLADNVPFDGKMVAVVRRAAAWYEKKGDKARAEDLRHALEQGMARSMTDDVPERLRQVGDVVRESLVAC